ncbi:hypothetical protein D9M68_925010 [compost metagenome]
MGTDGFAHGALAGDIGIGLACGERRCLDRIEHKAGGAGGLAVAVQIGDGDVRRGFETLLVGGVGHFDDGDYLSASRQFLDTTAEGGQGGFVAGQQIPVIGGRNNQ